MTTREDIKNVIAYLIMAFPNYNPNLDGKINSIDVMFDLLGDMSLDTIQTAVKACCAEPWRAFAPSAGEIRGMATQFHVKVTGLPSAGEAWAVVYDSFERMPAGNMAGGGHGPILDLPIVKEAVHQMGGYTSIGVDFFEQLSYNRTSFMKIYQILFDRALADAGELPQVTAYVQKQIEGGVKMLTDKLASKHG
jgi:hypothetical protein